MTYRHFVDLLPGFVAAASLLPSYQLVAVELSFAWKLFSAVGAFVVMKELNFFCCILFSKLRDDHNTYRVFLLVRM